jgi:hypothetical protein
MQITVTRLDIPRTRASWPDTEFNPAYVAPRQNGDGRNWWVADTPVPTDGINVSVGWAIAHTDEYIRIPLFSYNIVPQGDLSLAFMFQMGLIAANAFNGKVKSLHMVVGMPAELTYTADGEPESINYWFGFALA